MAETASKAGRTDAHERIPVANAASHQRALVDVTATRT
jgi:hypothetical protein